MQTKKSSTLESKAKRTVGKKAAPKKTLPAKKQAAAVQAQPVEALKKTIAYFYLLSYCPPGKLSVFRRSLSPFREALAQSAGMGTAEYFKMVFPEVCRRIVAFHQATREPEPKMVEALVEAARTAEKTPQMLAAFQVEMTRVTGLPGRAKPENRLHRNKGCILCQTPCRYGYFTLISDPQFSALHETLAAENKKPVAQQSPLLPLYAFTVNHIAHLTSVQDGFIGIEHLTGLSYCLLMLAMAKSRRVLPEVQLQILQAANQEFIRRQSARIGSEQSNLRT